MNSTRRRARLLVAGILMGTFALAACTPEEVAVFTSLGHDQQQAVLNHLRTSRGDGGEDPNRHVVSEAALAKLRHCESRGNYGAVSASGTYRGAYQFNRSTWNGVAARHYPHLNGVDPASASPNDQDRMARALWSERGRQPWPHCGRNL